MSETSDKQVSPPYLSLAQMERLIELVSSRNITTVSSSILRDYGFSAFDSTLAPGALRFLGLTDTEGKATQLMAKLRLKGEARKQAFDEVVRGAYKKLFLAVEEPYNLSPDELNNEMVVQYGVTPRVARGSMPVFRLLCQYAGLIDEGSVRRRNTSDKPRSTMPKPGLSKIAKTVMSSRLTPPEGGSHIQPISKGKMSITIPEELFLRTATDDTLNDDWRTILKLAHKFASTYIEEKVLPDDEVGAT